MKRFKTKINYAKAINRAAHYIDQHYDEKISLPQLASVANISEYHFTRIMQACVGLTPGELLKRHRLQQAYKQIHAAPSTKILDIALSVGYDNHSSFSRAFRQHFGISPNEVSQKDVRLIEAAQMKQGKKIELSELKPTFLSLDQFNCYGIEVAGFENRSFKNAAKPAFDQLLKILNEHNISLRTNNISGIPLDNINLIDHEDCRFVAAVKSSEDLSHLKLKYYPFTAGHWARFSHIGPIDTLWQTWSIIFSHWVIQNGAPLRDQPSFEIYEHSQDTPQDKRLTHIYIPIEE